MSIFYILSARLGQWEGVLVGGIFLSLLGYQRKNPWLLSVGLILLSTKPINVFLVGLTIVWWTFWWDWREQLKIYILPIIAFIGSLIWRPTWIVDYAEFLRATPPQTIVALNFASGFNIEMDAFRVPLLLMVVSVGLFGVFVWSQRPDLLTTVALALCINVIISTYIQLYHFVLFIPVIILAATYSKPIRYLITIYVLSIFGQIFIFKGVLLSYMPVLLLLILLIPKWNFVKTKMLVPPSS